MNRLPVLRRRRLSAASVALVALGLAGCGSDAPPSAALFPLEPGLQWTFGQTTELEDGSLVTGRITISTLAPETYEGGTAWRRRSDDGVDYWLRQDATGVYRVAMKSEIEAEPQKDPAPRYVLKEPLAVGTEWQAPTVAYLLKRRQGFPLEVRHENKPVVMRYAIESLQESVKVPAGAFERCVRVRGQASLRLYADPVSGWRDLPLVTTEWYCPGPGLVKLTREEPARSPFLTGGRYTLELHHWQGG